MILDLVQLSGLQHSRALHRKLHWSINWARAALCAATICAPFDLDIYFLEIVDVFTHFNSEPVLFCHCIKKFIYLYMLIYMYILCIYI